ncbi:DsbA family protein [Kocuria massiliensis]|uniref:DsbA family protein n=1 Tax=Kocuria massiliensis TaxID=1926282 RepID=UPI0022B9B463|nr:thioredoxin domain-containing protein [Kocuria massiliensis]
MAGVVALGCAACTAVEEVVVETPSASSPEPVPTAEPPRVNEWHRGAPTVVLYIDYQSRYAADAYATFRAAGEELKGRMNLEVKNFPLNVHGSSREVAYAMEAAQRLGRFPDMAATVLEHRSRWRDLEGSEEVSEQLVRLASSIGMDPDLFRSGMHRPEVQGAVELQRQEAEALHIASAPAFAVDGRLVRDLDASSDVEHMVQRFEQIAGQGSTFSG